MREKVILIHTSDVNANPFTYLMRSNGIDTVNIHIDLQKYGFNKGYQELREIVETVYHNSDMIKTIVIVGDLRTDMQRRIADFVEGYSQEETTILVVDQADNIFDNMGDINDEEAVIYRGYYKYAGEFSEHYMNLTIGELLGYIISDDDDDEEKNKAQRTIDGIPVTTSTIRGNHTHSTTQAPPVVRRR